MDTTHCPYCFSFTPKLPCSHCGWQTPQDNPPPALPLGRVLDGRYRIGRVLGQGGFGITYLAWDDNLQIRLAIKEYLPRDCASRAADGVSLTIYSGQAGEQFTYGLDRFLEEARALAHFDQHPGIVTVKNFFRAHGTGYCVMDFVEGITLHQYLEVQPDGKLSFETALKLLMPIMDALRAVHKEGLLHRDIAPDNIYLTRTGRVKLLDFGAARYAASEHSKSLSIILKPGYAPEEQYRTKGNQGPWTDVYGLAATFYRTITGKLPPESLDRMDVDELIPPSKLGIVIRPEQEAALLKGLAVKANQRFQSMAELQQAWRSGYQIPTPPPGDNGCMAKASEKAARRPVSSKRGNLSRHLAIAGSLFILVAAGIIWQIRISALHIPAEADATSLQMEGIPPQATATMATGTNSETSIQPSPENISKSIAEGEKAFDQGYYGQAQGIFRPLAETGNALAQFYIGMMYAEGKGVAKDEATGVHWYRKAAEQGDANAQVNLGKLYISGRGIIKDETEGVRWFRKAAEQGNIDGQFGLGMAYSVGSGVTIDDYEAVRWYRKAAEQGHANAQLKLGVAYAKGKGVTRDDIEAVRWYRKAAEQGHSEGQFTLGTAYAEGDGVNKDEVEAMDWYRKAALQGHSSAQLAIGLAFASGMGVAKDEVEAVRWFRNAADQGDYRGQYILGKSYAEGLGISKDQSEAVIWYRKSAEQGFDLAQFDLGIAYFKGHGVEINDAEAFYWFQKASEQGFPQAQFFLGTLYLNGRGVTKSEVDALHWYHKAAAQGNSQAQLILGLSYSAGTGVTKNEIEAVRWYRRAAEQGNADAQFYLALAYSEGKGVTNNEVEAVRWYRKAAEQGDSRAQYKLAYAYHKGQGVSKDQAEAIRWCRKAAEQGHAKAQLTLGIAYSDGDGVTKDEVEAVRWYRKAAEQGDASAQYLFGLSYEIGDGIGRNKLEAVRWYREAANQGLDDAKAALMRLGK